MRSTASDEKNMGNGERLMLYRGFKGLKQAIKVEFKLGRYSDVGHDGQTTYFNSVALLTDKPARPSNTTANCSPT